MDEIKKVLDAIAMAAGVIQTIAQTPGVNMLPYVNTIAGVAAAVTSAVNAGRSVMPYVAAIKETFGGKQPTESDMAALDAKLAELDAKVDAPLPTRDPDEPE